MAGYDLQGVKWSDSSITWSFATSTYNLDASIPFSQSISGQYQDAIRWAVQQWSSVSGLTFTQVADAPDAASAADIRIGFAALDTPSTGTIGDAHFRWTGAGNLLPDAVVRLEDPNQLALVPGGDGAYTYAGTQTTLQQVALHEIGHALGLGHASDPAATMYTSSGPGNRTLGRADIEGIQSLYGAPAATPVPVAAPAPAPAPSAGDADVLVLHLSEDAWQGDARFIVGLDGRQLDTAQTVTASHALGQTQAFTFRGDFGVGPHDLAVSFVNDAWGGTDDADRNLYVAAVEYNGLSLAGGTAALYAGGTVHFQVGSESHAALWVTDGGADGTGGVGLVPLA